MTNLMKTVWGVVTLASGLTLHCQSQIINHASSPASLKSSVPRVLEIVNGCNCAITHLRLGCVRRDGTIIHRFQVSAVKLSSDEKQTLVANDADLPEMTLCARLGSQLSVIQVSSDDGGEWHLASESDRLEEAGRHF